jgi:hypothetical protein
LPFIGVENLRCVRRAQKNASSFVSANHAQNWCADVSVINLESGPMWPDVDQVRVELVLRVTEEVVK